MLGVDIRITSPNAKLVDELINTIVPRINKYVYGFDEDKLELLYDPIISVNDIIKKKKEDIDKKFSQKKYILSIGRLTKQKNFTLLIEFFKEINVKYPEYLLVILGEGEERLLLEKLIKSYDLNNKIFLMGHKKNVYKYLSNCECFILSSRWEDPGFVLVEASFLNVPKISSNCKNGPSEILENGKGGFLFENEFVTGYDSLLTETPSAFVSTTLPNITLTLFSLLKPLLGRI